MTNKTNLLSEFEESNNSSESLDLTKILLIVKRLLPWILVCGIIGGIIAFIYAKSQDNVYQVDAKILIKDDKNNKSGGLGGASDIIQSLGVMSSSNSVDNELEIIQAYSIFDKVVSDLNLNFFFKKNNKLDNDPAGDFNIPWEVKNVAYNKGVFKSYSTKKIDEYNYIISVSNGKNQIIDKNDRKINFSWGKPIALSFGTFVLLPKVGTPQIEGEWNMSVMSPSATTDNFLNEVLTAEIPNKQTSIINLSLKTTNPNRGLEVMNKLIGTYISENVTDNNSINDSTMVFINDRLGQVTTELQDVEKNIQNFKQKNKITDLQAQTQVLLDATKTNQQKLIDAEIQLDVVSSLYNYLKNDQYNIIPSSLYTSDPSLSSLISQYNNLVVQKNRISKSATPDNPVIKNLNSQISSIKSEMMGAMGSAKRSSQIAAQQLRSEANLNLGQITKIPEQERQFLDISRQQAIKQELYLFLLKKREETAIGRSSTISNIRVIDSARVLEKPVGPRRKMIVLFGLLLGSIIPFIIYYGRTFLNIKINSKNDITDRTDLPIIGEIGHQEVVSKFEVRDHPRSILSEQFRILRTNLQFYKPKDKGLVMMVTSSMPGEGKTFISLNLATAMSASLKKKTVILGFDLRKPQLAKEVNLYNKKGYSEYAVGISSLDEIIYKMDGFDNLYVIPSGAIPPNPSELLMVSETEGMFNKLREMFDFIVVDCPPVVVTDYQIIGSYVDLTLYVSRMGYTEKKQLEMADRIYKSKRLPKMNLIINDLDPDKYDTYNSNYYYQYGAYEESAVKKPWYKRWFNL